MSDTQILSLLIISGVIIGHIIYLIDNIVYKHHSLQTQLLYYAVCTVPFINLVLLCIYLWIYYDWKKDKELKEAKEVMDELSKEW